MVEDNFVVFSAFGSHCSPGVSLLIGHSFNAIVNLGFVDDGDRLVVADVAVKTFEFRMVAVYVPNILGEKRSFFRRLAPFLDDSLTLCWAFVVLAFVGASQRIPLSALARNPALEISHETERTREGRPQRRSSQQKGAAETSRHERSVKRRTQLTKESRRRQSGDEIRTEKREEQN